MDLDQRSLNLIREWKSETYASDTQEMASLQCILIAALGEQGELTKLACCEAVKRCEEVGVNPRHASRVRRNEAMGACLTIEI